ncbi:hypothetical protein DXG03_006708 [Asterophora parasitica]|uniref:Mitochondrial carrier n=1 Tax=Asterophora parasitica TaxID=117018 RepID=A0A9P7GD88_9AGAR|nr:hypothetical protein DXG03_006708 [Asterophora parasitica]
MSELSWTYLFFSLACIPFTGYLVRFRLAYHPKNIPAATGTDEGATSVTVAQRKPSFFNVSTSVFKNEGPLMLIYPSPPPLETRIGTLIFGNIIYSFGLVWVYRAITSPTPLPLLRTTGIAALHTIFTPHEIGRLYSLVYPGVLPALFLTTFLDKAILTPIWEMLQRGIEDLNSTIFDVPLEKLHLEWKDVVVHWRYAAVVGVVLAKVVLLTPIEVVCTRMAAQRRWGPAGKPKPVEPASNVEVVEVPSPVTDSKSPVEKGDVDVELELEEGLPAPVSATVAPAEVARSEFVLRYRPDDKEPYKGVLDCARKIVREEGWGVLYRGWWVTLWRVSGLGFT